MEKKLTEGFRAWLRESLRLLFLLYFQPTKFQEEVDDIGDERYPKVWDRVKAMLGYHLRLLPWTVLLAILFRWGGQQRYGSPIPGGAGADATRLGEYLE